MATAKEAKATEKKTGTEPLGRYSTVALTQQWLSVLIRSEEAKGLGPSELVKKALDDVRSGAVTPEQVEKAAAKAHAAPAAEEEKAKKE